MKFDALYKQIFIAEADDVQSKVAQPEDVDVEPLPLPEPSENELPAPVEGEPSARVTGGGTISEYITKIQDFSKILNDVDGDCLNKLIKRLDRPATPYENIASKISSDLVRVVEGLTSIEANLVNYTIAAAAGSSNA